MGLDDLQAKVEVEALSVSKLKYQNELICKEIAGLKKLVKAREGEIVRKEEKLSEIENRGLGYFLAKKIGIYRS